MIIHFICVGNIYRSRLAETYFNSKKLTNVKAISSGTNATICGNRPVSWYAQRLIDKNGIMEFEKPFWTKTNKEILNSADCTIFFSKDYFDFCVKNYGFNSNKFEIWELKDIDPSNSSDIELIKITENTFESIKQKIDDLIERKKFVH